MPARQLEQMLAVLPDIAAAVNRFSSPAVQTEVFWLLVMAADVDWRFVDWEHPALRPSAPERWLAKSWMELEGLVGGERLSEAYRRLSDAEARAAEPHFAERASRDSLDAEGLRELAARVADGEPVTLRVS
ncbi:hypothetical protein [Candidatus Poriferisodalis sp.]|uniref:hypothetical protein n=1 Tax=Candidatus Poriferisodalis sp. TaxID=3101277 RepID=UPI003AF798E4